MPRYKPNVTLACVIKCQDKYLMVEELIEGQLQYNQPAGHLEANESLLDGCIREVYEETGLSVSPAALIGIYQYTTSSDLAFLRFTYFCELATQLAASPQDSAINRALWLTLAEIKALKSQLRSPLVLQCIEDLQSGKQFSTDVVNCQFL